MPVSSIQKYVVKKLDLSSEAEVSSKQITLLFIIGETPIHMWCYDVSLMSTTITFFFLNGENADLKEVTWEVIELWQYHVILAKYI